MCFFVTEQLWDQVGLKLLSTQILLESARNSLRIHPNIHNLHNNIEPEHLHLDRWPLDVLHGPSLQVTLATLLGKLLGQTHPTECSSTAVGTAGIADTSLVKGHMHSI